VGTLVERGHSVNRPPLLHDPHVGEPTATGLGWFLLFITGAVLLGAPLLAWLVYFVGPLATQAFTLYCVLWPPGKCA